MLALMLSSFAPTARFGLLMAGLLLATLAGDLLLLPALLALRRGRKVVPAPIPEPVIATRMRPTAVAPSLATDRVA
jgi:hypothetical protein